MRVLAVGAAGFIGPHVVYLLTEQRHDVAVIHRGETIAILPPQTQRFLLDRNDITGIRQEVKRFCPVVVLDMVPYTERQAEELVEAVL